MELAIKQSNLVRELQTVAMTTALGFAVLVGIGNAAHARAVEPGAYGRVRFADQGGTILRAAGEGIESDRATVNAPLFPGDLLRTDSAQRVEVQLAGGSMIGVEGETDVIFQSLPNPTAASRDNTILVLRSGVIRITSQLHEYEVFRIDTADAAVYLNGEGEFRVDAAPREGTRVTSLRGVAEVVGSDSPVLVSSGMSMVLSGLRASSDDSYEANDRHVDLDERKEVPPYDLGPVGWTAGTSAPWNASLDPPPDVSAAWRGYHRPGEDTWVYAPYGWPSYGYCGWEWSGARVPWGSWSSYAAYYGYYYDPICLGLLYEKRRQTPDVTSFEFLINQASHDARGTMNDSRAPNVDPRLDQAIWAVNDDRAAHKVVQDRPMKRGGRGSEFVSNPSAAQPPATVEPRATALRQARFLDAPRWNDPSVARPAQSRIDAPRWEAPRQPVQPMQAPQAQAPRAQPQQPQYQRPQPQQGRGGGDNR